MQGIETSGRASRPGPMWLRVCDSGGMSPFLIGHPALRVFAEGDLTRSWIDVVIAKQIGSDRGEAFWASLLRSKLFERCLPSGSHQAAHEPAVVLRRR